MRAEPADDHLSAAAPAVPRAALAVPATDVAAVAACSAVFTAWTWAAGGPRSLSVPAIQLAACASWYVAGAAVASASRLRGTLRLGLPQKLLLGYALVNTALFALAWLSPLGVVANFALIALGAAAAFAALRPRLVRDAAADALPELLCCALSLAAATLWARDCIDPIQQVAAATVFRPWIDSFSHAAQINVFSAAHGARTIEDFQLAFVPARFYHYAPYLTPALVKAASSIAAYRAFGAVLVPQGIFLSGLAAFALAASWWGAWPGLFAAAALLLLPDGALQGARNPILGYWFMQCVGPGGLYGVALLALAWLFVLRGCADGRPLQLVAGWACAALIIAYKAHLFVAAAPLLWLLPPLSYRGLSRRARLLWLALAVTSLGAGLAAARLAPGVPLLRLDGSSTMRLLVLLFPYTGYGLMREAFLSLLTPQAPWLQLIWAGTLFLVASTLGALPLAYALLALRLRKRIERPVLLLPLLFGLNFLVMALGLAFDDRGIGTPDELLDRPFVWLYFATAVWVGGAAAFALLQETRTRRVRTAALAACALLLLAVPATQGRGIQRTEVSSQADLPVPDGLVRSAEYVRAHSRPQAVAQDARFDPTFSFAALSERRAWVILPWIPLSAGAAEKGRREKQVRALLALTGADEIAAAARSLHLRFLLLHPGDAASWPAALLEHPDFASGGFRVFGFAE